MSTNIKIITFQACMDVYPGKTMNEVAEILAKDCDEATVSLNDSGIYMRGVKQEFVEKIYKAAMAQRAKRRDANGYAEGDCFVRMP